MKVSCGCAGSPAVPSAGHLAREQANELERVHEHVGPDGRAIRHSHDHHFEAEPIDDHHIAGVHRHDHLVTRKAK